MIAERLLIELKKYNKIKTPMSKILQEGLTELFKREVRQLNLVPINNMNNLYISGLKDLRKNRFSQYISKQKEIVKIYEGLQLNESEEKIASIFSLPIIAYYFYQLEDFSESLNYTHQSIINDDYFLKSNSFLYGHKIQQLHNVIRINFKSGNLQIACKNVNNTLLHLITGEKLDYPTGMWYENYSLEDNPDMIGMVYQIFTETIKTISELSSNIKEEEEFFKKAFAGLTKEKKTLSELDPLVNFINIKLNIYHNKFENTEEKMEQWIDNTIESSWIKFCMPLFYNLFISLSKDNYSNNKINFKKCKPV